jgi:hypothetical protein
MDRQEEDLQQALFEFSIRPSLFLEYCKKGLFDQAVVHPEDLDVLLEYIARSQFAMQVVIVWVVISTGVLVEAGPLHKRT